MKAVGIPANSLRHDVESLVDLELPAPVPEARDLLVKVEAISVNPLDTKMRRAAPLSGARPRILGWDAAGTVVDAGSEVTLFKTGDKVFYAGSITRPGSNAEFQVVDERIVGRMPATLGFAEAAALPVASLAAWEAMFDRMRVPANSGGAAKTILIIGGAGGVGSMAIQLAKAVAELKVVATASRAQSREWCVGLGADLVVDHGSDMVPQLAAAGIKTVDYILCLSDTDTYFPPMAKLVAPQGHICALVENASPLPMQELRSKSASFSWEGIFTRSLYATPDMVAQHHILNRVAELIDMGRLRSIAQSVIGPVNAENLRKAHAMVESGRSIGKVVLSGFGR
jgi:zinc-binding alcohol dehydrogenase family protein